MEIEEYYEKMMLKIKSDSNISSSEFTKLFDILLEINICNTIIENKFKINNKRFNKDEIISYKEKLIKELKELNIIKEEGADNGISKRG